MTPRKKLIAVLLSIAIVLEVLILIEGSIPDNTIFYKAKHFCSRAESEAANIAAGIADYFSDPDHLHIKPGDTDWPQNNKNPWTFIECDDAIYIYVYDLYRLCPMEYQNSHPEWEAYIYTRIF